jgi:hypothetical protein
MGVVEAIALLAAAASILAAFCRSQSGWGSSRDSCTEGGSKAADTTADVDTPSQLCGCCPRQACGSNQRTRLQLTSWEWVVCT